MKYSHIFAVIVFIVALSTAVSGESLFYNVSTPFVVMNVTDYQTKLSTELIALPDDRWGNTHWSFRFSVNYGNGKYTYFSNYCYNIAAQFFIRGDDRVYRPITDNIITNVQPVLNQIPVLFVDHVYPEFKQRVLDDATPIYAAITFSFDFSSNPEIANEIIRYEHLLQFTGSYYAGTNSSASFNERVGYFPSLSTVGKDHQFNSLVIQRTNNVRKGFRVSLSKSLVDVKYLTIYPLFPVTLQQDQQHSDCMINGQSTVITTFPVGKDRVRNGYTITLVDTSRPVPAGQDISLVCPGETLHTTDSFKQFQSPGFVVSTVGYSPAYRGEIFAGLVITNIVENQC